MIKRRVAFFMLALVALCVNCLAKPVTTIIGTVTAVTDGDTIKVLCNKQEIKVRLWGIDAPEKRQDYGTQAKNECSVLCFGKIVTVLITGNDRYKRVIGKVTLPSGSSLNEQLVRNGFAWWYRKYAPNNKTLESAENEARKAKRGLWAGKNPIPPWTFRAKCRMTVSPKTRDTIS